MRYWLSLVLLITSGSMPLFSLAQNSLPSLGDRISGTVSLDQEYEMGQGLLRSLRRGAPTIPDALLNEYLENVTYRLASRSQLQDHRLSFVIIDSEELNAFASPGGVIGVNSGLFINAQSEAEFASVMAHEIAHVSQRHFARGVDEAQTGRLPQLATMMAAIVVMVTSDTQHGAAALTAAQGRAVDNQLRFSRSNEAEADRIGQDTMFDAGFDPNAMSSLFERLVAINRYGRRPPEFLLSHPVTESRVADARGRASRYPAKSYGDNLEYLIMRARILGHYAEDKERLIEDFQQALDESDSEMQRDANRYGLVVAYWEDQQFAKAAEHLAVLLEKEPNRISYAVTRAEILTSQNEPGLSINFLQRHLDINPDNHPLTMALADALVEARDYEQAATVLEGHALLRPNDFSLWFRIAETQGQAGDISKVHQARSEYFMLIGDYRAARDQLQFALRVEAENGVTAATEARLRQKIRNIESSQQQSRN
jgi:beta-barrel assembly-enhancing protease